jgi:hypothetical protein
LGLLDIIYIHFTAVAIEAPGLLRIGWAMLFIASPLLLPSRLEEANNKELCVKVITVARAVAIALDKGDFL